MKKRIILNLLFAAFVLPALSQNENKIWYFGTFAGLDFKTSPPTVLTNSGMHATGGSSSVSDAMGNLLFYTNGSTVYNNNNQPMANGSSLGGLTGAIGSGLIVKKPGSQNIYYVFSMTGFSNPMELDYSIVDMSLAAGLGSVTTKGVPVHTPVSDRLASTKHCNGTDVWVISHEYGTNIFRSHLITSAGVSASVVSSTVGVAHGTATPSNGEMKFSPDGKKLGMAWYYGDFEMYDFDPSTGTISNYAPLSQGYIYNFGCEFSPDGTKFYGSRFGTSGVGSLNGSQLMQWDLCAGSPTSIAASQFTLSTPSTVTPENQCAGMSLGPDGKIYVSSLYQQSLSLINNPNAGGSACAFSPLSFDIQPEYVAYTFPLFVIDHSAPITAPVTWTANCQVVSFNPPPGSFPTSTCGSFPQAASSVQWFFGDGVNPGASSSLSNPQYAYAGMGAYTAKLVLYYPCRTDTIYSPVTVTHTAPVINVSGRTEVCKGEQTVLTASGANTYSWNGTAGGSSMAVTPTASGFYTVSGSVGSSVCPTTSTVVAVTVQSCNVLMEEAGLRFNVFPNPFTNSIAVESNNGGEISITDISGNIITTINLLPGRKNIETSSLQDGIYFFRLKTESSVKVLKVVKAGGD